mmetsp:Transcript_58777/g.190313  ORF Transcript_58777/g.190313 Transcript_58777/m.190313 type:complete len:384 (-) Transcript_58777:536-1687(-)
MAAVVYQRRLRTLRQLQERPVHVSVGHHSWVCRVLRVAGIGGHQCRFAEPFPSVLLRDELRAMPAEHEKHLVARHTPCCQPLQGTEDVVSSGHCSIGLRLLRVLRLVVGQQSYVLLRNPAALGEEPGPLLRIANAGPKRADLAGVVASDDDSSSAPARILSRIQRVTVHRRWRDRAWRRPVRRGGPARGLRALPLRARDRRRRRRRGEARTGGGARRQAADRVAATAAAPRCREARRGAAQRWRQRLQRGRSGCRSKLAAQSGELSLLRLQSGPHPSHLGVPLLQLRLHRRGIAACHAVLLQLRHQRRALRALVHQLLSEPRQFRNLRRRGAGAHEGCRGRGDLLLECDHLASEKTALLVGLAQLTPELLQLPIPRLAAHGGR